MEPLNIQEHPSIRGSSKEVRKFVEEGIRKIRQNEQLKKVEAKDLEKTNEKVQ